jgi:hypothetical protein
MYLARSASAGSVVGKREKSIAGCAMQALERRRLLSANTITVANLNDTGSGSLRRAISDANAAGGATTINFASGLSGILVVATPLPSFTGDFTLSGPGESVITIASNAGTGLGTLANVTGKIKNLTITGTGLSIDNYGVLTLSDCDVANAFEGGIINESGANLTVLNCNINEITNNNSNAIGIDNSGTASVIDSSVTSIGGDGIDNSGSLAITNCTIDSNNFNGIQTSGALTVTDSTIDENTTGISASANFTLKGSIVANDATDLVLTSATVSGSHDVIGDGTDNGTLTDSQRGTSDNPLDPMLADLANNGGPTPTQALLVGSPALGNGANFPVLDAGGNDITATDQRGTARPQDGVYDAGAYQSVPNVGVAPQITSADLTTFISGLQNSFTVVAAGTPTAKLSIIGVLPPGVSFVDNGNGTGTLSGAPIVTIAGVDSLDFKAKNGISPNATQVFELTVELSHAPTLSVGGQSTFVVGTDRIISVTTTGDPTPRITESGALPGGVVFTALNTGSATIEGTPVSGSGGVYDLTLTARNGVMPAASQPYTLTVDQAPAITSSAATTFTVGAASKFKVTTSGYPAASFTEVGTLPPGIVFKDLGAGVAKLRGTPAAGTAQAYDIVFKATNAAGTVKQKFVLTVQGAVASIVAKGSPLDIDDEDGSNADAILLSGMGDDTVWG